MPRQVGIAQLWAKATSSRVNEDILPTVAASHVPSDPSHASSSLAGKENENGHGHGHGKRNEGARAEDVKDDGDNYELQNRNTRDDDGRCSDRENTSTGFHAAARTDERDDDARGEDVVVGDDDEGKEVNEMHCPRDDDRDETIGDIGFHTERRKVVASQKSRGVGDAEHAEEKGEDAPSTDEEAAMDAGAEYEREREERIARNRAIMRDLGIQSMVSKGVGGASHGAGNGGGGKRGAASDAHRRRAKAARAASGTAAAAASVPTRRSTRSTRHVGSFAEAHPPPPTVCPYDMDSEALIATRRRGAAARAASGAHRTPATTTSAAYADTAVDGGDDAREHMGKQSEETFNDSSVLRYTCGGGGGGRGEGLGGGGGVYVQTVRGGGGESDACEDNEEKTKSAGFARLVASFAASVVVAALATAFATIVLLIASPAFAGGKTTYE